MKNNKGFSIIEALITIGIVFGGVSMLLSGADQIFKGQKRSNVNYSIKSTVYASLVSYLKSSSIPRAVSSSGDQVVLLKCMNRDFYQIDPKDDLGVTGDFYQVDSNADSGTPPEDVCPTELTKYIYKVYWSKKSNKKEENVLNIRIFFKRGESDISLKFSRVHTFVL